MKNTLKNILKISCKVAKSSSNYSVVGFYQPKVPNSIKKNDK